MLRFKDNIGCIRAQEQSGDMLCVSTVVLFMLVFVSTLGYVDSKMSLEPEVEGRKWEGFSLLMVTDLHPECLRGCGPLSRSTLHTFFSALCIFAPASRSTCAPFL